MTDNKKASKENKEETNNVLDEKKNTPVDNAIEEAAPMPSDNASKNSVQNTSKTNSPSTMTNKSTPPKSSTTQKTESTRSTSSQKMKNQRPIGQRSIIKNLFWFIVIFIIIAVMAYGAWQLWLLQDKRFQQTHDVSVQQYQQLQSAINDKNAALEKQLANQQEQFALLVQQSSQEQQILQQRLDVQLERINALSGVSRDGWMLEEARHLLRLATQRQLTGSSASSVIGLLEAADNTLRDIDIPDLFIVREQIQNDIVALKIMPNIDREGMYLQLDAIIEQVVQLPAAPLTPPQEKPSSDNKNKESYTKEKNADTLIETKTAPSLWQAIKQRTTHTLSSLDNYIRITHHDETIKPVLSDAQRAITQENIRLLLVQAQVALLREEKNIYQQSLKRAAHLLNMHYAHYEEKTSLVSILGELEQRAIISKLPNVSSSLNVLNQYIKVYTSQANHSDQKNHSKDKSEESKNNEEKEINLIEQEAL
ncbi:uroporphyrinogen-III C-methyltransferase [Eionea flava]